MLLRSSYRRKKCRVLARTLLACAAWLLACCVYADTPAAPSPATLALPGGDYLLGELAPTNDADQLRWRAEGFLDTLEFPVTAIQSVRIRHTKPAPPVEAEYSVELLGGDSFFGNLQALDAEFLNIESPEAGLLRIARKQLVRIERRAGAKVVFDDLSGLDTWSIIGPSDAWRSENGGLVATQPNTAIHRDLPIPERARIEIELAWKGAADFALWLRTGLDPIKTLPRFQLDVVQHQLVALCESHHVADLAVIQSLGEDSGRIALQIHLDQSRGTMLVTSQSGTPLASLALDASQHVSKSGIRLLNRGTHLKLERLRVFQWNGEPVQAAQAANTYLRDVEGHVVSGEVTSYDAGERSFLVQSGEEPTKFPAEQLESIQFAPRTEPAPRPLLVQLASGASFSGQLQSIDEQYLTLRTETLDEPLKLPLAVVRSLVNLATAPVENATPETARGRLEMTGCYLSGSLVESEMIEDSCLVWRALGTQASARIHPQASGRIVYRDPPAASTQQAANSVVNVQTPVQRRQVRRSLPASRASKEDLLHLRTGDKIPCTATTADEQGVHLKTAISDVTFLPHAQIKVLELMPSAVPIQLDKEKRQRLLTLPRMRRDHPPTQLFRAANGDYLRGRLVGMDSEQLQVELGLDVKNLPRENIARIIWLHPDEFDRDATVPPPADPPAGNRVQAIQADGQRLTFFATQCVAGRSLVGQSVVLGNCQVELAAIDALLFGRAIDVEVAKLVFQNWRLTHALDPLEFQADRPGGGTEGLESVLVGKPAPEIDLPFVDGQRFRLDDFKGQVLVLDFWASWCGPCLQTMPQIDAVVREFADQQVALVAVNLQESASQIQAALKRLQLETNVALDQDGRVAERYGATAIPQTVIIDRGGRVARLFVGGGARFDEKLRLALQEILKPAGDSSGAQP